MPGDFLSGSFEEVSILAWAILKTLFLYDHTPKQPNSKLADAKMTTFLNNRALIIFKAQG